jgi:hypothetical protein
MATKRTSLVEMHRLAERATDEASTQRNSAIPGEETVTTAIHLPKRTLALLRRVAVERANQHGGRPSVSALITDLVEGLRGTLQSEIENN